MSRAYDEGYAAGLKAAEVWTNPHVSKASEKDAGLQWFAGWCYGMQQRDSKFDLPEGPA